VETTKVTEVLTTLADVIQTMPTAQICIVSFNSVPLHTRQVTISRDHLSPSKDYIRFGDCHGDELTGWLPLEELDLHEVLAEYLPGAALPYIQSHTLIGNQLFKTLESSVKSTTKD
jgi:hypothetical protein